MSHWHPELIREQEAGSLLSHICKVVFVTLMLFEMSELNRREIHNIILLAAQTMSSVTLVRSQMLTQPLASYPTEHDKGRKQGEKKSHKLKYRKGVCLTDIITGKKLNLGQIRTISCQLK